MVMQRSARATKALGCVLSAGDIYEGTWSELGPGVLSSGLAWPLPAVWPQGWDVPLCPGLLIAASWG